MILLMLALAATTSSQALGHAEPPLSPEAPTHSPEGTYLWRCWSSLTRIHGCADELVSSFFKHEIKVSKTCCQAIVSLPKYCLPNMFQLGAFGGIFPILLGRYCHVKITGLTGAPSLLPPAADANFPFGGEGETNVLPSSPDQASAPTSEDIWFEGIVLEPDQTWFEEIVLGPDQASAPTSEDIWFEEIALGPDQASTPTSPDYVLDEETIWFDRALHPGQASALFPGRLTQIRMSTTLG
ncbi:Prolamin-like domain [Dillenia turbinata]|uniref:Prolamin-like domain n=1 Tax=Dillenia turbinata TaxID=194707 RepID=A0AAN8VSI4_9MAGN